MSQLTVRTVLHTRQAASYFLSMHRNQRHCPAGTIMHAVQKVSKPLNPRGGDSPPENEMARLTRETPDGPPTPKSDETALTRSFTASRQQRHNHIADGNGDAVSMPIALYHAVANFPLHWAIGLTIRENRGT